jgi:glycosyltransferase involved in cell wall biosynthesis
MRQGKRVLIISKYFFPHPNVGGIRMTQWSRFLPQWGWQPTILCQYHGYSATHEELSNGVHPEVSVEYFNPPSGNERSTMPIEMKKYSYKFRRKLLTSSMGYWSVPDMHIGFFRAARRRTESVIKEFRPDVVLTTSPHHSIHDLGMWAQQEFGISWVADFRDPYLIFNRTYLTFFERLRWQEHKRYERRIYERANLITHATAVHGRWARIAYPEARDRIVTIFNGFPPELVDGSVKPAFAVDGRFSIRSIGFCGNDEAVNLGRAIKRLIEAGENLELRLVGNLPSRLNEIKQDLSDRLIAIERIPHAQVMPEVAGADLLVCIASLQRAPMMGLSTKVLEAVATGNPVILINPKPPDRQFVRDLEGVKMIDDPTVEELVEALRWALSPASKPPAEQLTRIRRSYNRRAQAAQLAKHLDRLVNKSSTIAEPQLMA